MGTLGNTFGKKETSYGSGKTIWLEIKGAYPVGGSIENYDDFEGSVIPAGSMCAYDQVAGTITIAKSTDIKTSSNAEGTIEPASIKGLLKNDVYIEDGVTYATGSVVFAGEIFIDRLAETIPAEVLAVLPMIVPIYEKETE